jgi:hypothetical protein
MRRAFNVTVTTFVLCSFGVTAFAANVTSTHPRPIATHAPIVIKTAAPTPRPHPTDPHHKNPANH